MTEEVSITNKKGLKLAAVVHRPEGEGKFPGVLVLHGFTGYKTEPQIQTLAESLAQAGIGAIRFDASGFGDSEGKLETDYRYSNYLADIEDVYDYFKDLEWLDSSRIGVGGHSMGAMLSVEWGAKHPELKAVCASEGPSKLMNSPWIASLLKDWKTKGYREKNTPWGDIRIPYSFMEDERTHDVLAAAGKLGHPLLVILGLADESVAPEDARLIYDAATEPKEKMEVPNMRHDYKHQPEILAQVNQKIVEFFKKYL